MKKMNLNKRTGYGTLAKVVIWHPAARDAVRSFPEEIRVKVGYQLHLLQQGEKLQMPQARPMSSVASGAYELRVKSRDGIFRVFYILKLEDGIFVFHAFQKKTEKTPVDEIKLGQKRLKELLEN